MPRLHQIIAQVIALAANTEQRKEKQLPNGLIIMADCSSSKRELFFLRDESDKYYPRTQEQKAKMLLEAKVAVKDAPFPVCEPHGVKNGSRQGYVFLEADSVPVQDNEGVTRLMSLEDKAKADAATAAFSDRGFARRVEDAVNLKLELCPVHTDSLEAFRELYRAGFAQSPHTLEQRILEMQTELSNKAPISSKQKDLYAS